MKKTFHALVINPQLHTVTAAAFSEVEQLAQFYLAIGCSCVTALQLPNGDTAWGDDEGLLVREPSFFRQRSWYPEPLAGIWIVTGTKWIGGDDQLADCLTTVEEVQEAIRFLSPQQHTS